MIIITLNITYETLQLNMLEYKTVILNCIIIMLNIIFIILFGNTLFR